MAPTTRLWRLLGLALPALALAALGLFHPPRLRPPTADTYLLLHLVALPLFPLLALGPWLLAGRAGRGLRRVVVIAVRVLALVFALYYTALDLLAGAAAAKVVQVTGGSPAQGALVRLGDRLGDVGSAALIVALFLVVGLVVVDASASGGRRTWPLIALGAVLAIGGAWLFRSAHIFHPYGVQSMVALAAGYVLLELGAPVRQLRTAGSREEPVRAG